ncbi:MAG: CheR family methyltransferase, partial [Pseudomonadota bacterium]
LEGMPNDRLDKHFTMQDGLCTIQPHLRKMVVFARQDVTVDPPFTKLDLVVCRNLLIYLTAEAQRKALSLFHFGLKRNGLLVLGSSEGVADLSDEFELIDGNRHIFRKGSDRHLVGGFHVPTTSRTLARDTTPLPTMGRPMTGRPVSLARAYDALMDAYVPPGLLVSVSGEVAHSFGGASRFLKPPVGAASLYASDLVVSELRLPIISALARVQKSQDVVTYAGIRVGLPGEEPIAIRLICRPLAHLKRIDYVLITFEENQAPLADDPPLDGELSDAAEDLQTELKYTREQLQAAVEELETSNEELQATNEELVAANEELQSTNEELHSVNEELSTLNQEHEQKIAQLEMVTEETDNLIESLDTSTLFVDRERRIRKFTPQAAAQFGLLKHDLNRRIAHFNTLLASPAVAQALERVENDGERVEREVLDADGKYYLLRTHPYVRTNGSVDGSVLSFVDIERIKMASQRLTRAYTELQVFTYAVSHDLIGPARRAGQHLDALATWLGADASEETDGGQSLAQAKAEVRRLQGMIHGLLKLSRVETEGDAPVPVSLEAAVHSVVEELRPEFDRRGVSISLGELPTVVADNRQLKLLLYNLLRHAMLVSPDAKLEISVAARKIGANVVVTVTDNGDGFAEADLANAFEIFFNSATSSETDEAISDANYGGLAITKRVVERHGGEIWIDRLPNGGTGVNFSLKRPYG